ncbi:MAG: hypothetical protein HY735_29165 [Verrucomicrobia bacterium]|nr:hypothetical protein [Verrucomicrobiota bacterium]
MNTKDVYQRRGWWWQTMGFTKTHLIGVFVTVTVLGTVGVIFLLVSCLMPFEEAVRFLVFGVCLFLAQIGVLLSSILSLLFYMGSRVDSAAEPKEETDETST